MQTRVYLIVMMSEFHYSDLITDWWLDIQWCISFIFYWVSGRLLESRPVTTIWQTYGIYGYFKCITFWDYSTASSIFHMVCLVNAMHEPITLDYRIAGRNLPQDCISVPYYSYAATSANSSWCIFKAALWTICTVASCCVMLSFY